MLVPVLLAHTFGFQGDKFVLDGETFQMFAGEIAPSRISRDMWEHHIVAAKAMGLNTITATLFWNQYESTEGVFDFSSPQNDIGAFLSLCASNGLFVLLRPGPYVGSDADFGGMPSYLLREEKLSLRSSDAGFRAAYERWFNALIEQLKPFRDIILMVQLDNMYSMHSPRDLKYLPGLAEFWHSQGYESHYINEPLDHFNATFFPANVALGVIGKPGQSQFDQIRRQFSNIPIFASDAYTGFPLDVNDGIQVCAYDVRGSLDWYRTQGYSYSLHVFAGGSNFGSIAGSSSVPFYSPRSATYDFLAPVSEAGRTSNYYNEYREVMKNAYPEPLIDVPANPRVASFGPIAMKRIASIFDQEFIESKESQPQHFEHYDQNQGIIVYETTLPVGIAGELILEHIGDYAQFYMNGQHIFDYNRSTDSTTFKLGIVQYPGKLEILVDAYGHADLGYLEDRKGIYGSATFAGYDLTMWTVKRLPLGSKVQSKDVQNARLGGIFVGSFNADATAGTYLDMSAFKKAAVYVNGKMIGRYFSGSLQNRLFCPAGFLVQGLNSLAVVDIEEKTGGEVVSYESGSEMRCI